MKNNSSPVYLYEVDDLLGGDALSPYELAYLAGQDIRWSDIRADEDIKQQKAA